MSFKYHAPLDSDCLKVVEFYSSLYEDPMSDACDCLDEICELWESRHHKECERCREYGLANIEVV